MVQEATSVYGLGTGSIINLWSWSWKHQQFMVMQHRDLGLLHFVQQPYTRFMVPCFDWFIEKLSLFVQYTKFVSYHIILREFFVICQCHFSKFLVPAPVFAYTVMLPCWFINLGDFCSQASK